MLTKCIFKQELLFPKKDENDSEEVNTEHENSPPSKLDYCIYFIYQMIYNIRMVKQSNLNKLEFVDIFYQMTELPIKLGVVKNYGEFTDY